jgi:glycosyltransferase involved in cell wall biosynthesis
LGDFAMRVLFALPGFHRFDRGAEVALISVATELAKVGEEVTLIGSGRERIGAPYRFVHAASARREKFESFPSIPILRNEYCYEELTFVPDLLRRYRPADYDVTLTCGYPFTNWVLRRPLWRGRRPPHVFVTENGDWPAQARNSEYRYFGCEALVCTNPEFYTRNQQRWRAQLIPNGVDCERFTPGLPQRDAFGLPEDQCIVLMVSALVPYKRVEAGIEAVSKVPDAHLVVAGDGPLRDAANFAAARWLPGRFTRLAVPPDRMPALYRSADVFLHMSKAEPFGNVFLEAMACGVPVVAQKSPGYRWIVGDDEFLADTEDLADVARQIEAARAASPSRRSERALKAAAFSWKRIGGMYRKFLQEIVMA